MRPLGVTHLDAKQAGGKIVSGIKGGAGSAWGEENP